MKRLKLTDKDGRVLQELDLEENAFVAKYASEGVIEVRGVIPGSGVSPSQVERFDSVAVGRRAFPPNGTVYLYALKTDTSDTHPWGVVYKAERPMAWHSNQWMAAQGFVPEGGW